MYLLKLKFVIYSEIRHVGGIVRHVTHDQFCLTHEKDVSYKYIYICIVDQNVCN